MCRHTPLKRQMKDGCQCMSIVHVAGEDTFDIYEGKVVVDGQEYIIPVLAGDGIPETILGLQWLQILPLAVNFGASILTLG